MRKRNKGFTIIELLVSVTIVLFLSYFIFKLVQSANRTSAFAECRGMLRTNVQLAARALERDVASCKPDEKNDPDNSRVITPGSPTGGTVVTMFCPKYLDSEESPSVNYFDDAETDKELYETVSYELSDGKLTRVSPSGNLKIAQYIKSIDFPVTSNGTLQTTYDGKVRIVIIAEAKPQGSNDVASHSQELIVAIRQLQNQTKEGEEESHWKQKVSASDY